MNITLKTEYALLAIEELIEQNSNKPVSRKQIAKNKMISEHFLEKIFINLKKKGIIKSVKGPGGGFILGKNIDKISLWDIYSAVDDPYNRIDGCYIKPNENACPLKTKCKTKNIWFKFAEVLKKSMSSISLNDIIKDEIL
jgi:Rrf2 family iron-sulfur cluster assembly transcriptional regulator